MPLSEFQLIDRFFARQPVGRPDVILPIGDDCALLRLPEGMDLAVTMDTMVEGRHFPAGSSARAIGHKLMAVNLSDLAAMGAEPAWATLSLSLPSADEAWLAEFAAGLFGLAKRHGVQLVGGDTVRGPLVLTLQAHGFTPRGGALRRDAARPGDLVCVTGTLGDAGAGLRIALGQLAAPAETARLLRERLDFPEPRIAEGLALRPFAGAAIDISDGLVADLGHILEKSGVGATVEIEKIPLSEPLRGLLPEAEALRLALAAGDDYELCFTLPPERRDRLEALPFRATVIGTIEAAEGLRLVAAGRPLSLDRRGFDHFAGE